MGKYKISFAKVTDIYHLVFREVECDTDEQAIQKAKEMIYDFGEGFYVKVQRIKEYNGLRYYNQVYYSSYSKIVKESIQK